MTDSLSRSFAATFRLDDWLPSWRGTLLSERRRIVEGQLPVTPSSVAATVLLLEREI